MNRKTAAALAILGLANAAPFVDPAVNSAVCPAVDLVVDILHLYPSATPFCSSFLHIPTITTTKTVSSTASFTSAATTTILTTVSTFTSSADPVTAYSTFGTTITTCSIPASISTSGVCAGCPAILKNIACSAISTACGCLGIPTPTSTVTLTQVSSTTAYPTSTIYSSITATVVTTPTTTLPTTSTSTVNYCPTPPSCNNEGIRWTPEYQATASVCGGLYANDVGEISIYGSTQTFESDYFTLNHVGYIFAQSSGTYTFTLTQPDDIALLWLGSKAYSGWTRANADATAVIVGRPSASATVDLVQGQYLPFRVVFGQAQGAVSFYLTLTAPDGTVILNSDTPDSPFLVQFSCDGTSAPAFPAFGSET
ncbi:unnamed protein product [Aureobasidium mustum]|uniref:PA14 domain-containing protein n=1 Tax=Aureobasidium mustum TaxID=2773714 RepID=A0A9N8PFQ6_9PEZI|nr:unnamed protein product [Aureobasidium mustum]